MNLLEKIKVDKNVYLDVNMLLLKQDKDINYLRNMIYFNNLKNIIDKDCITFLEYFNKLNNEDKEYIYNNNNKDILFGKTIEKTMMFYYYTNNYITRERYIKDTKETINNIIEELKSSPKNKNNSKIIIKEMINTLDIEIINNIIDNEEIANFIFESLFNHDVICNIKINELLNINEIFFNTYKKNFDMYLERKDIKFQGASKNILNFLEYPNRFINEVGVKKIFKSLNFLSRNIWNNIDDITFKEMLSEIDFKNFLKNITEISYSKHRNIFDEKIKETEIYHQNNFAEYKTIIEKYFKNKLNNKKYVAENKNIEIVLHYIKLLNLNINNLFSPAMKKESFFKIISNYEKSILMKEVETINNKTIKKL